MADVARDLLIQAEEIVVRIWADGAEAVRFAFDAVAGQEWRVTTREEEMVVRSIVAKYGDLIGQQACFNVTGVGFSLDGKHCRILRDVDCMLT